MTATTPILKRDLGDGVQRLFYLSADELRRIKLECGRGFYTIYTNFSLNAEPSEVATIIRLALVGGGTPPAEALALVEYYCSPPRTLRPAYLLAYEVLEASWSGTEKAADKDEASEARAATVEELDNYFVEVEAQLVAAGFDASVLRGKSFSEIRELLATIHRLQKKDAEKEKPPAPSAAEFNSIKESAKRMK